MNNYIQFSFKRSLFIVGLAVSLPLAAHAAQETHKNMSTPVAVEKTDAQKTVMQQMQEDSLAESAGQDLKSGFSSVGSGFKKGAKVTGKTFHHVGTTVGHAFKKAGGAIHDYFAGKGGDSKGIEERDIQDGDTFAPSKDYNNNLDNVGNEPVSKNSGASAKKQNGNLAMGRDFSH